MSNLIDSIRTEKQIAAKLREMADEIDAGHILIENTTVTHDYPHLISLQQRLVSARRPESFTLEWTELVR